MGEMRGWMYDNLKNRIAVDDPCCRRMVCAKDSTRSSQHNINFTIWHKKYDDVTCVNITFYNNFQVLFMRDKRGREFMHT